MLEIARLRAERAALLGFANHAAAVTADETAGTPEAVAAMLTPLAASAAKNAREEQADLDAMNPDEVLEAADWAFFTEKVRQAKFDVDTAALRPWFEAERVLQDGVFFAANRLYGVDVHRAPRPGRLSPGRPRLRGRPTPTARRSGCTCSTSTPATRSAAGPG